MARASFLTRTSLLLVGLGLVLGQPQPIVEPYPLLHDNHPSGNPVVPSSPDPLVGMTWSQTANITGLQRYNVDAPVAWLAEPASAFTGVSSLASGKPNITVAAAGALRLGAHPVLPGPGSSGGVDFELPSFLADAANLQIKAFSEVHQATRTSQAVALCTSAELLLTVPSIHPSSNTIALPPKHTHTHTGPRNQILDESTPLGSSSNHPTWVSRWAQSERPSQSTLIRSILRIVSRSR